MTATVDPHSAIGQLNAAYTAFANYFSGVNTGISSGSFPTLDSIVAGLDYSEILRLAQLSSIGAPSHPGAAAVEATHHIAAVVREYGYSQKTKADLYSDGSVDSQNEANFYNALGPLYTGMLTGIYTPGATS